MMKALEELREKLCIELDGIAAKQEIGAGDLEAVHKLTDTIKNIDKIIMLEDEEYSQRGSGNSYGHYVRGHYSREGGNSYNGGNSMRSYRGSSRRGYSGARGEMREQLEELMNSADSEREREAIRRCLSQIE